MFYNVSFTYCKTWDSSPLPTASSPLPTSSTPLPTSSTPLPTSSSPLPTSSSPLSFSPSSPMLPSFLLKIKLLLITLMLHCYFIFLSLYSPLLSSPGFLPCPPSLFFCLLSCLHNTPLPPFLLN